MKRWWLCVTGVCQVPLLHIKTNKWTEWMLFSTAKDFSFPLLYLEHFFFSAVCLFNVLNSRCMDSICTEKWIYEKRRKKNAGFWHIVYKKMLLHCRQNEMIRIYVFHVYSDNIVCDRIHLLIHRKLLRWYASHIRMLYKERLFFLKLLLPRRNVSERYYYLEFMHLCIYRRKKNCIQIFSIIQRWWPWTVQCEWKETNETMTKVYIDVAHKFDTQMKCV